MGVPDARPWHEWAEWGRPLGFAWLIGGDTCISCLYGSREKLGLRRAEISAVLAKYGGSRTRVFVETYKLLNDPLRETRERLNRAALSSLDQLSWLLHERSPARVLEAAALANSVDIWLPGRPQSGLSLAGQARVLKPARLEQLLGDAQLVVYLLDNAGEAVVDMLAAMRLAEEGREVVLVARSMPYELDVTEAEARRLLIEVARRVRASARGVRVVGTGSAYPAAATGHVSERVAYLLVDADAVVSKGIANLEALAEFCSVAPQKTVVALRAKCAPIANLLGARLDEAVVAPGYRCMSRAEG